MKGKGKYIIVDDGFLEHPILFSHCVYHNVMAKKVGDKVISAGFFDLDKNGKFICFGKSISLNVEARDIDSNILDSFFNY
jgi:hypothetical protein